MTQANIPSRVAIVLGGGGLKGFAHIGVLRALKERGIRPVLYAGTSIGALIGAARAKGVSLDEMEARARALQKSDLFRINHVGMLLERMKSPSLYLEHPLRTLCDLNAPDATFDELRVPLLVNTVDVERGTRVIWGLPGLREREGGRRDLRLVRAAGILPAGRRGRAHLHRRRHDRQSAGCHRARSAWMP